MQKVSFKYLYEKRCRDGKPYYWKPQEIIKMPLLEEGATDQIGATLAAAELLEVDVQEYISETFRNDERSSGRISPTAKKLLLSNIADESVHATQFRKASETYGYKDADWIVADSISQEWLDAPGHPLQKAALLEIGVFVACSLPLLLRFGSNSLGWVAKMVAEDEQRHVATNLGILTQLGYDPFDYPAELTKLRESTVAWLTQDLKINEINQDWFLKRSEEMATQGFSEELQRFTSMSRDVMPFEVSNKTLVY
jgi:hypothetical protein